MPQRLSENFDHYGIAGDNRSELGVPVDLRIETRRELIAANAEYVREKSTTDINIEQRVSSD